jgi:hypothetical protein
MGRIKIIFKALKKIVADKPETAKIKWDEAKKIGNTFVQVPVYFSNVVFKYLSYSRPYVEGPPTILLSLDQSLKDDAFDGSKYYQVGPYQFEWETISSSKKTAKFFMEMGRGVVEDYLQAHFESWGVSESGSFSEKLLKDLHIRNKTFKGKF